MVIFRPGQRILNIPGYGVQTSRRAVSSGNGLLNNLVAYWPLNEAAGANDALDLHTNGMTLTQQSSPGAAAGKVYSTARTFVPASNYYFFRNSEALLQAGNVDLTVAMWLWSDISTYAVSYALSKWSTASSREYGVFTSADNRLRFGVSSLGTNSHQAICLDAIPFQQWFLFVGWYDFVAGTVNSQINNGTIYSTANPAGIFAGTAILAISRQSNVSGAFWNGRIGPVAMWKSAAGGGGVLTSAQRLALWNGGAGLPYASFTV